MATIDRNRFRKTYGATRVVPKYETVGESSIIEVASDLELLSASFVAVQSVSVSSAKLYNNPVIIVTPTDNVNIYVSSITNTTVTTIELTSSSSFTGTVYIAVAEALN